MLERQGATGKRVLHSTGKFESAPLDPPQISAVESRPLVTYTEQELDELFDELEREVEGW